MLITVKRLYRYFAPHGARWLIAAAALGFVHVLDAAIALALRAGVDALASATGEAVRYAAAVLGLALFRLAVLHFGRRRNALVSSEVAYTLRNDLYAQLCAQGHGFYARHRIGDLIARATQDIETVRRFFRSSVHRLISLIAVVLVAPWFMLSQSPRLALTLAPTLFVTVVSLWWLSARVRQRTNVVQAGFGELSEAVQQNLSGIRTIQLHGQEARELAQLADAAQRHAKGNRKLLSAQAALIATSTLGAGVMTWSTLQVGGQAVLAGQLSIGMLTAFLFYLGSLLTVLRESAWPIYGFLGAAGATARIFEVLDEPRPQTHAELVPERALSGRIEVRGLCFAYPAQATQRALTDISLSIEAGELVAIVGRVGSGKSTLLRCLARQLDPDAGQIRLGGQRLDHLPLHSLRSALTFVSQDCTVFASSLAENIAYDDPTRDEASIWAAVRGAQLASTIERFPQRLATLVGERGVTLSGGQRQRTALARGLIRRSAVLLLDDCLSALDKATETAVVEHLRALRGQSSVVLVTHHAFAARQADRIYVLDAGRLQDVGTHAALLGRCAYYRQLHAAHARETRGEHAQRAAQL